MKSFKHRVTKHVSSKRERAREQKVIARHVAPPKPKPRAGARARGARVRDGHRVERGLLREMDHALKMETPPPASVVKRRALQGRNVMHKMTKELARVMSSCQTAHEALAVIRGLLSFLIEEIGEKQLGDLVKKARVIRHPAAKFFAEQLQAIRKMKIDYDRVH